jgi:hypothetical protein
MRSWPEVISINVIASTDFPPPRSIDIRISYCKYIQSDVSDIDLFSCPFNLFSLLVTAELLAELPEGAVVQATMPMRSVR